MRMKLAAMPCLALCLIALCACESTPSGTPPVGAIVDDLRGKTEEPTADQTVNKMATDLTMKLVAIPAIKRPIATAFEDAGDMGLGAATVESLKKSKMIREPAAGEAPELLIRSGVEEKTGRWRLGLLSGDGTRLIWGQSLPVDMKALQPAK